jgi:hypothetical protein
MEKINRDDDVNALPQFALQRAHLYDECAHWAGQQVGLNSRRLESGQITSPTVIEVFRRLESGYLEQRDAARTSACSMWSN